MSYRVIAHSRSGEVSYRGTEVHASYGAAEREARTVARRAGLTDVHVVKDGKRIVGEVKAVAGARRNPSWTDYKDFVELARFQARHEPASDLRVGDRVLFGSPLRWSEVTSLSRDVGKISIEARDLLNGQLRSGHSSPDGLVYMWRNHKSPSRSSAHRLNPAPAVCGWGLCTKRAVDGYRCREHRGLYRPDETRGGIIRSAPRLDLDRHGFASKQKRRNPDIEALSWPTAWGTGGSSKKDFKAYVAAKGMDAEVMCHGMRSVPGSLRDLPRAKYVVYGGTHNPNVKPAKWYATLDLTGATPKVS